MKFSYSELKSRARQRLPRIYEQRLGIVITLLAVIVTLLFFRDVLQMILVMAGFIVLGILSMMYNRFVRLSLGLELILLGTVITGMVYGRIPAMIVGMVALFFCRGVYRIVSVQDLRVFHWHVCYRDGHSSV